MLFLGSYSHLLHGLEVKEKHLEQVLLHKSHTMPITCVAASGTLLATGSVDTVIWVFKSSTRKEVGALMRHEGTVTDLAFYRNKQLISCSEDGTVCVWRVKDWECLLQFKAHANGVRSLALHPTGKLCITLGEKSRKAKLWNMMTAKCSYEFHISPTSLPQAEETTTTRFVVVKSEDGSRPHFGRDHVDFPQRVVWNAEGDFFCVQWSSQVDVHCAASETTSVVWSVHVEDKTSSCCWLPCGTLVIGTEKGWVIMVDKKKKEITPSSSTSTSSSTSSFSLSFVRSDMKSRVKCVAAFGYDEVCVACSDGVVAVVGREGLKQMARLEDRLTCLTSIPLPSNNNSNVIQKKEGHGDDEVVEVKQEDQQQQQKEAVESKPKKSKKK